jgi:hypothetical protein
MDEIDRVIAFYRKKTASSHPTFSKINNFF